jgi:hypothetical protein
MIQMRFPLAQRLQSSLEADPAYVYILFFEKGEKGLSANES